MTRKGWLTMSGTLAKIFPILDLLYIYQNLEYDSLNFIGWFLQNPLKRNLQKKHRLELSKKAFALLLGTVVWEVFVAYFFSLQFSTSFLIYLLVFQLFTPIFIILAHLTYLPLEIYLKSNILEDAKLKIAKLPDLKIVAITGSFGKTSTKDILFTLLWKNYYVVKTPKSFNTPLGIAQTILEDVKQNTQILIVEVGAYKIGEVAKITKMIKPQIGIITAVAPQHLEKFGSIENIAKAKFELAQNLKPDGVAILNGEYEILKSLSLHLRGVRTFFYGIGQSIYATDIESGTNDTSFTLNTPKGKVSIKIPLIGRHHIDNFLAATAAALNLGLTLREIKARASLLLPTPHRLEIRKQGSFTIIDNTYNTNPKAAQSSLQLLNDYPASQRIVITPGLIELGKESSKENQALAKNAAKIVDEFIIVGENAKNDLRLGLKTARFLKDKIHFVKTTQDGINLLSSIAKPGAAVLLENDLPDQYS